MVGEYYCPAVVQVVAERTDGRVVHSEYNQSTLGVGREVASGNQELKLPVQLLLLATPANQVKLQTDQP
jgi:hypothetical protein